MGVDDGSTTDTAELLSPSSGNSSSSLTNNINGGNKLTVWCDMETDGGGYTYFKVDDGRTTNRFTESNTCHDYGLQLAVWRTQGAAPWLH